MTHERRSTYSMPNISKGNVCEALFARFVAKFKGLSGIRLESLGLFRRWCEDNIITLIQKCMRVGYRLHAWTTAIDILLLKQSKLSDPIAKARLATALLSCVGKVVKIGYDSDRTPMREERSLPYTAS
jgi:hypothetical protein